MRHFHRNNLKNNILKLLEILLTNNYFTFDDKLYHQTIGASMCAIPPSEICDTWLTTQEQIKIYARFRDDGFMTWEKASAHDVADFFQTANNFHNLLRFTCTTSPQEFTFLDTSVYKRR